MTAGTDVSSGVDAPGPQAPRPGRRHRGWWLAGSAVVLLLAASLTAVLVERNSTSGGGDGASGSVSWLSGASGDGVADGEFEAWRGTPAELAVTWADNNDAMVEFPQLLRGAEYADWDGALDMSIGAIGDSESWAEAAEGAYDQRWRESLTVLRGLWGDRAGALYLRFAHEMNGDWYPWSVDAGETTDFLAAWGRFRALQQEIFPESQLVFCLNRFTRDDDLDWREMFPDPAQVDVLAVDYYNNWPVVDNAESWAEGAAALHATGAPQGIETFRQFAEEAGLPLAVPEWSGNAESGDHPEFVEAMHQFFGDHAGEGPGEVLYEALFNVSGGPDQFVLFPDTRMPESAEAYRRLW